MGDVEKPEVIRKTINIPYEPLSQLCWGAFALLHIEQEVQDISVLYLIVFAFK